MARSSSLEVAVLVAALTSLLVGLSIFRSALRIFDVNKNGREIGFNQNAESNHWRRQFRFALPGTSVDVDSPSPDTKKENSTSRISVPFFDGVDYPKPTTITNQANSQSPVVCWNGHIARQNKLSSCAYHFPPSCHLFVSGEGCSSCVPGLRCHFIFIISCGHVNLLTSGLNVRLIGPAALAANLLPLPSLSSGSSRALSVHYLAWDEGQYMVEITGSCAGLDPGCSLRDEGCLLLLASYPLSIQSLTSSRFAQIARNPLLPLESCEDAGSPDSRWALFKEAASDVQVAEYLQFDCNVGGQAKARSDIHWLGRQLVQHLVSKQMSELTFIGGSRQLALFLTLSHMISASLRAPLPAALQGESLRKTLGNMSSEASSPLSVSWDIILPVKLENGSAMEGTVSSSGRVSKKSSRVLKMSFHFLPHLLHTVERPCNGTLPLSPSFAALSARSGVILVDSPLWDHPHCCCTVPGACRSSQAVSLSSVPWLADALLHWVTSNRVTAHVLWYSAPVMEGTLTEQCAGQANVSWRPSEAWLNGYLRDELVAVGIGMVDLWSVEAPVFDQLCQSDPSVPVLGHGWHSSCFHANLSGPFGFVGEASVQALAQVLLGYDAPQDW